MPGGLEEGLTGSVELQPQGFIYRGNEDAPFIEELQAGRVEGMEHNIYYGELRQRPAEDPIREELGSLDWVTRSLQRELINEATVPITGGASSSLAQTRRFSGGSNYAMVLRASETDYQPIDYDYDWFNRNPGALDHVLSSARGEIRLTGSRDAAEPYGDLVGAVKLKPQSDGPHVTVIRDWSMDGRLPATSEKSRFADEQEWIATAPAVDISGAVEGVVSIVEELSIRVDYTRGKDMVPADSPPAEEVIGDVFDSYADPIPDRFPYYLLVVDDFQDYKNTPYEGWREVDIRIAYDRSGEIAPRDVPPKFRGVPHGE